MTTEKSWQLDTPDGSRIYGVLNSPARPARSAVFIVHGLTGNMNEYLHKRAADVLSARHDVYRFNLYDGEDRARRLVDCTIRTHADDLNTVLGHFAKSYDHVFLIGHSYGGPTIMTANPSNITAVSLWDPSFNLAKQMAPMMKDTYLAATDYYMIEWGVTSLIGRPMHDEACGLDEEACLALARAFRAPVQVLNAELGVYVKDDKSYHSFGDPRNIRDTVPGSAHCFHEGESCEVLLRKTADWFGRFCDTPPAKTA